MKIHVEITLDDDLWGEYKDVNPELFLEDLFDGWEKDGVTKIELINNEL